MYRYLHGCGVTKGCGMLQVADPRPAPEDSSSLAGPCTPDLNGFIVGKKKKSGQSSSLRHEQKTDWKVLFVTQTFSFVFFLVSVSCY